MLGDTIVLLTEDHARLCGDTVRLKLNFLPCPSFLTFRVCQGNIKFNCGCEMAVMLAAAGEGSLGAWGPHPIYLGSSSVRRQARVFSV